MIISDNKFMIFVLTEYRQYKTQCTKCSQRHKGELPAAIDNTIVGNELKALIATMVGEFHLSKSQTVKFLDMPHIIL